MIVTPHSAARQAQQQLIEFAAFFAANAKLLSARSKALARERTGAALKTAEVAFCQAQAWAELGGSFLALTTLLYAALQQARSGSQLPNAEQWAAWTKSLLVTEAQVRNFDHDWPADVESQPYKRIDAAKMLLKRMRLVCWGDTDEMFLRLLPRHTAVRPGGSPSLDTTGGAG